MSSESTRDRRIAPRPPQRLAAQALSTERYLKEVFADAARDHLPDAPALLEHLKDEPFSNQEIMGVIFGNREMLTRLYEQGRVKPEHESAFCKALGLRPANRTSTPPSPGMSSHNQGLEARHSPHRETALAARHAHHPADAEALGKPASAAKDQAAAARPGGERANDRIGVRGFVDRAGRGIGQATSRAWEELTGNENLHEGAAKGFAMAGEVVGFAGKRIARDIATSATIGATGKILGKAPRIGKALGAAATAADGLRKIPEAYLDYLNFPGEMANLGRRLKTHAQADPGRK